MEKLKKLFIVIVLLIFVNQVQAVNWNSIEVNDVEYYVQTNKFSYEVGENIEILYRITNNSLQDITFGFGVFPVYNFWAESENNVVWSGFNFRLTMGNELTIVPGQSVEFPNDYSPPFLWNMKDDNGAFVTAGNYNIIGGLYRLDGLYDYAKVAVSVEIIPEPIALLFILAGLPLLRKKFIS